MQRNHLQNNNMMAMKALILLLTLLQLARPEEILVSPDDASFGDFVDLATSHPCHENGVVASWCDATVNPQLRCMMHPTLNLYSCKCDAAAVACPTECVGYGQVVKKTKFGIQCRKIPQDEPNYILRAGENLPAPHHCENNALVANWCNELTVPQVDCLLLPSLDEYVCSCHDKAMVCPQECVGGGAPDKKTKHGIRCRGIPVDQPNYVLKTKK
jgi:hypothetical protein